MKKILKWVLITVGIVVSLLVLAWIGMFLKIGHEVKGFSPLETSRITNDVFVAKDDFANVYLIRADDGFVIIDCGNSPEVLAGQMKTLGIDPSEVSAVLLTHTDGDHVGALRLFPDATLYMSREEEQMINGGRAKFLWFGNSIPRTDYILLDDRQTVHIGGLKVEGILVSGHTAGMMAFLIEDKYLFSGDIASLKEGRLTPIPPVFDMDHYQAVASIDIIRHLPTVEYIFTGHWGYTDDYKAAVK